MRIYTKILFYTKQGFNFIPHVDKKAVFRFYHQIPFLDLYQKTTGQSVSKEFIIKLKKKHPSIETLTHDRLQCTLQILDKFSISALEACHDCHIFCMNPIAMDNYGEILKECGFVKIIPKHIIRYHTIVRSRTIAYLKDEGLIKSNMNLEETLQNCFHEWPDSKKNLKNFSDKSTCILTIRMSVLEQYLIWKLSITSDQFQKYCRNYLPLKHKPMSDIQEALSIAQNDVKFNLSSIRSNGFIISSDPINTKLIIKNVRSLARLDIREVIRLEPAILKNNYNALLKIRDLLEEYRIPVEAQQRCLRVYCMRPSTVKERLDELVNLKEYQVLSTNPRVLSMVVHKKKMLNRLSKIQAAKKQCFSLNHLVASNKVFNTYITSFGDKVCGKDIATLISTSLQMGTSLYPVEHIDSELVNLVLKQLRKHKYWLHAALHVVDQNIRYLIQKRFDDKVILNNCQIVLYPVAEIENYIEHLLHKRINDVKSKYKETLLDASYNNIFYEQLTNDQILSLVLYEIEKKYHFSGDGIWTRQDGVKIDVQNQ